MSRLLYQFKIPRLVAVIFLPGVLLTTGVLVTGLLHQLHLLHHFPWLVQPSAHLNMSAAWFLVPLFLDLCFLSLWASYIQVYHDEKNVSLFLRGRFLLIPWKKSISLSRTASIVVRNPRPGYRTHTRAAVILIREDGEEFPVIEPTAQNDALELAQKISLIIHKPIVER